MDAIARLFKDPTWWFTAVFIAILASLFASYLRDGISFLTAKTSSSLQARRIARLTREQKRIDFLVSHPNIILMEIMTCTIQTVYACTLLITYVSVVLSLQRDALSYQKPPGSFVHFIPAAASYLLYKTSLNLKIVLQAKRKHEDQLRLSLTDMHTRSKP